LDEDLQGLGVSPDEVENMTLALLSKLRDDIEVLEKEEID
jgi:hypothetical protein